MDEKLKLRQIENIILEFHPDQLKQMCQSQEQIHNFLSGFGYHFTEGLYKSSSKC